MMKDVMILLLAVTSSLLGLANSQIIELFYDQNESITSCSKGLLHKKDILMIKAKVYEKSGLVKIFFKNYTDNLCWLNISNSSALNNGSCYYQRKEDSYSDIFVNITADSSYSLKYVQAVYKSTNGTEYSSKEIILPEITDSTANLEINGQNIELSSSICIVNSESTFLNVKFSKLGSVQPKWVQMSVSNPIFSQVDRDVVIFHHNYDAPEDVLVKLQINLCGCKEMESRCSITLGHSETKYIPQIAIVNADTINSMKFTLVIAVTTLILTVFAVLLTCTVKLFKSKLDALYTYRPVYQSYRRIERNSEYQMRQFTLEE